MKLVIVTTVDQYKKEVIKLFKDSDVKAFSELDIEGFKTSNKLPLASNWFASNRSGADSEMFFAFTELENAKTLFKQIKKFNKNLDSNNPVKGVIIPVEDHI